MKKKKKTQWWLFPSPAIIRCTPFHSASLKIFFNQASASRASFRFFFLSYLFIDRNTVFAEGGIKSLVSSAATGKSNALKFKDGYRTEGRLLLKDVKVDMKVSAVKLLFTRTTSARPANRVKQQSVIGNNIYTIIISRSASTSGCDGKKVVDQDFQLSHSKSPIPINAAINWVRRSSPCSCDSDVADLI